MELIEAIKKGFSIALLNAKRMEEVAKDKNATMLGFAILAIAGAASALGYLAFSAIIQTIISIIIGFFIFYSGFHFVAKLLGGKATGIEYFRVISHAFVVYSILAIPYYTDYISIFVGSWLMVVNIYVMQNVHKLSFKRSLAAVLISLISTYLLISFFIMGFSLPLSGNAI